MPPAVPPYGAAMSASDCGCGGFRLTCVSASTCSLRSGQTLVREQCWYRDRQLTSAQLSSCMLLIICTRKHASTASSICSHVTISPAGRCVEQRHQQLVQDARGQLLLRQRVILR